MHEIKLCKIRVSYHAEGSRDKHFSATVSIAIRKGCLGEVSGKRYMLYSKSKRGTAFLTLCSYKQFLDDGIFY